MWLFSRNLVELLEEAARTYLLGVETSSNLELLGRIPNCGPNPLSVFINDLSRQAEWGPCLGNMEDVGGSKGSDSEKGVL